MSSFVDNVRQPRRWNSNHSFSFTIKSGVPVHEARTPRWRVGGFCERPIGAQPPSQIKGSPRVSALAYHTQTRFLRPRYQTHSARKPGSTEHRGPRVLLRNPAGLSSKPGSEPTTPARQGDDNGGRVLGTTHRSRARKSEGAEHIYINRC